MKKSMNMLKTAIMLLSAISVLAFGLSATLAVYAAEDVVVYDASTFSSFSGRTKQTVAQKYSDAFYAGATYKDGDSSSYYSTQASTVSPYNKGVLTADTHKVMTAMSNYYRWLTGANAFTIASSNSSTYAPAMQAQALDRNFQFAHDISDSSKPADMPDSIWKEGFYCTHNILAGGTPASSITRWLDEGYYSSTNSWGVLGHRDCILNPTISGVQYGYSGKVSIGKFVGTQNTYKETFSAFPAPGYMPINGFSQSGSAWTVYLNPSKVKFVSGTVVTVKITNLNTNVVTTDTTTADTVHAEGSYMTGSPVLNFAQPKTSKGSYVDGDSFKVEITGLKDVATGKSAKLVYTVNFFDLMKYAPSTVTKVDAFGSDLVINANTVSLTDLKKIASLLPKTCKATNELGATETINLAGDWTVDQTNKCFVNKVSSSDMPANMNDKNGLMSKITVPYTVSPSSAAYTMSLSYDSVRVGQGVTIRALYPWNTNLYCYIYQVSQTSTGYKGEFKYDSTMSGYSSDSDYIGGSFYNVFKFDASNLKASDSGDYYCLYYVKNSGRTAYISTPKSLTVSNSATVTGTHSEISKIHTTTSYVNTNGYLESLAKVLPKTTYIETSLNDEIKVTLKSDWTVDAANSRFINYIDAVSLPSGVTDPNSILKKPVEIKYDTTDTDAQWHYFRTKSSAAKYFVGSDVVFDFYNLSCYNSPEIVVHQITDSGVTTRFNSLTTPSAFVNTDVWYGTVTISNSKVSDSGKYISITYIGTPVNGSREVYTSNVQNVLVTDKYTATNITSTSSTVYVYSRNKTADEMSMYAQMLPKTANVNTDMGTSFTVDLGEWTPSGTSMMTNYVNVSKLPSNLIVPDNYKKVSAYVYGTSTAINVTTNKSTADVGETVTFTVNKYSDTYPKAILYKYADGKATKVFEYTFGTSETSKSFTISKAALSDSGTYVATHSKASGTSVYYFSVPVKVTIAHTEAVKKGYAATCTTAGLTDGTYCSGCKAEIKAQEPIPALGHNLVTDPAVAATCLTAGKTEGSHCSRCSYVQTAQTVVPALGHEWKVPLFVWSDDCSTCQAVATCRRDSSHKTTSELTIKSTTTASTCSVAGNITYRTSYTLGGKTYTSSQQEALSLDPSNHKDSSIVSVAEVAPTCETVGHKNATMCSDCGQYINNGTTIPAIGHNYAMSTKWSEDNSTCTITLTCRNDSTHKFSKTVNSVVVNNVEASCTKTGEKKFMVTMTYMGIEYEATRTVPVLKVDHTFVTDSAVTATCTTDGLTEGSHCSVCGYVKTAQTVVPATGHSWSAPTFVWYSDYRCTAMMTCEHDKNHGLQSSLFVDESTIPATCTTTGKTVYTAEYQWNGKTYSSTKTKTLAKDPANHPAESIVIDAAASATCELPGSTEASHCEACNTIISVSKKVPELGHNYVMTYKWSSDATSCEFSFTCNREGCGHKETRTVDSTLYSSVPATCMSTGSNTYVAKLEFNRTTYDISKKVTVAVNPANHPENLRITENAREATCIDIGYTGDIKCGLCEKLIKSGKAIPVDSTNHSPKPAVKESEILPTCSKTGSYDSVVYCANCREELSRTKKTVKATGNHIAGVTCEENRVEPECGKAGSYDAVVNCTVCGTEMSRTVTTIPATGTHPSYNTVKENVIPATCTEPGSCDMVYYCTECKAEIQRLKSTIKPTGIHTYVSEVCSCGLINKDATLAKVNGQWIHVENGVQVIDTTLVKYNGSWWYVKDGVLCKDETLVKYNNAWWYVKDGRLCKDETLVKYNNAWWYVKDGKLCKDETLVKYNNAWWYVKDGKLCKDFAFVKYNNSYWFCKDGKMQSSFTGKVTINGVTKTVTNGKAV